MKKNKVKSLEDMIKEKPELKNNKGVRLFLEIKEKCKKKGSG